MNQPSAYIVRCPGCDAANRIPADRIGLAAKCGKCQIEIPTDEKNAQPEESFKMRCAQCGAKNRIPQSKLKAAAKCPKTGYRKANSRQLPNAANVERNCIPKNYLPLSRS
jgi:uncharacterized paraquat-inducible protein A